jgi:hypothetical protein
MNKLILTIGMGLLSLVLSQNLIAQEKTSSGEIELVLHQDSLFWQHYNNCNVDEMRKFFTDDVEFYHDKGGIIKGADSVISVSKRNLCSNENFRLRREVVAGSVKVFPMKNAETIYGAILSGEHKFYVLEKGKEPRLDGLAKFTHLFMKTDSGWKMSRVLSYDHGPAPYVNSRKKITLNQQTLNRHVGNYHGTQTGLCVINEEQGVLKLAIGDKKLVLYPETETVFFATDRDLTFEFATDTSSKKRKMIVRENGRVVEEAIEKN